MRLHGRLQKVEIGTGVAEFMSAIYRTTVDLDDCFAYTKAEMGVYDDDQFDIDLTDWTPYAAAPYNMAPSDLAFCRSEVDGLQKCGVAEPCISPWGFAALIVHR